MNLLVYLIMLVIFLYTAGFAKQLWKEQNKIGSIVVFALALSVIITPFFSVLSW